MSVTQTKIKDLSMTILLDYYGGLLTDKQRETLQLYYEYDLSLGEISLETGISRQGVLGCIQKSGEHLRQLEQELCLARRTVELTRDIEELEGLIMQADMQNESVMAEIDEKLVEIKTKL
ncbi:MAG: DNA-binding protein [Oscillospiraceae bacterium]|jgi:predicted DNA-binding protein YlxM (UPF0122 family)|nr:DNA-binding protein [Oscillospiraceae bacterium]